MSVLRTSWFYYKTLYFFVITIMHFSQIPKGWYFYNRINKPEIQSRRDGIIIIKGTNRTRNPEGVILFLRFMYTTKFINFIIGYVWFVKWDEIHIISCLSFIISSRWDLMMQYNSFSIIFSPLRGFYCYWIFFSIIISLLRSYIFFLILLSTIISLLRSYIFFWLFFL